MADALKRAYWRDHGFASIGLTGTLVCKTCGCHVEYLYWQKHRVACAGPHGYIPQTGGTNDG